MEWIEGIKQVDPGFRVRRCSTPRVRAACIVLHLVESGDLLHLNLVAINSLHNLIHLAIGLTGLQLARVFQNMARQVYARSKPSSRAKTVKPPGEKGGK